MINEKRQIPTTQNLSFGTVSTASGTIVSAGSVDLEAGTYAIQYTVAFASNATGYRAISLNSTATPSDIAALGYRFAASSNALNGLQTFVTMTVLDKLSSSTTRYFHVLQNSGSTLNCYPRVFIVKLA